MSGYRHRTADSYNGSLLSSNEPEGASSTASSEYDRYYWKNVHNPHKVLKMRHYFGGMESEAADAAAPDALSRAKSMPSLEKWTPDREWGLAHKGISVSELRARFEAMESQVAPEDRRRSSDSRQSAMRRARSNPGLERASPEPRIVPQRRAVASSERSAPRSAHRSSNGAARGTARSWTPEDRRDAAPPERSTNRTYRPQTANGAARSPEARSWAPEERRFREQMERQKGATEAASQSPEWLQRASEMKARRDAREEERLRALEAYLREPVAPLEFSSRRGAWSRADSDSVAPSLPSSDPPSAIVIDSVQLRSASSEAATPWGSSSQRAPPQSRAPAETRPPPETRAPPEQKASQEQKAPIADWRYHYQVERTPIAGDFDRNRERFEVASRDEDERLAQKQAHKQLPAQKLDAIRETDLDAPSSSPRSNRVARDAPSSSPRSNRVARDPPSSSPRSNRVARDPPSSSPHNTHLVLARQTTNQQQQQKAPYDPEMLNPYGSEQLGIARAVISLGQKDRGSQPPRLDDFIDSVQQYARPPPTFEPSGRPRDIADGSEMAWKEAQTRPVTAKKLGPNEVDNEAIYANINVIRQHQQQQEERVQREQHIAQQKVMRHQLQFRQNGQRPQSQQQQPARHPQPRHSSTQPSQRPDRAQAAPHSQRQHAPPTQPGWEPARCVWDSRYHTWRRYDRTTNDYIITQPANRVPHQGSSPLTESLRPMLVDLDGVTSPYDVHSGHLNSRGQAGISLPNGLTLYGPR